MPNQLPPHLSGAEFARALSKFEAAVGAQGALVEPAQVAEFRDPFAFAAWTEFEPSAVLMPTTVEELQAILRIANEHKVPLWTSSQGRNNGYGGPAPRVRGAVALSLRRMNR